jgi:phage gpG-like protein
MFVLAEPARSPGSVYDGALRVSFTIPGGKQNAITRITGANWKIDMRKPLAEFGRYMYIETDKTFRREGRGEVFWPTLKKNTQESRVRAGFSAKPALTVTGGLKRSVKFRLDGSEKMSLYSTHPLAKVHQKGASIPEVTIKAKPGKTLRFFVRGKPVFAKWAWRGPFKIPPRPFMFFTDQDRRQATRLIDAHVMQFFVRHA